MSGLGHIVAGVRLLCNFQGSQLRCARCLTTLNSNALPTRGSLGRGGGSQNLQPWLHLQLSNTWREDGCAIQVRSMSQKKNFFSEIVSNIKQEFEKNKEMKENLKKFRDEADKLDQSDALKKAREKYQNIFGTEQSRGSEAFKKLQETVKENVESLEKTDLAKKSKEFADEMGKAAQKTAEKVSKSGEQLSQSAVFKTVSQGVKAVKEEIDETALSRAKLYKAPVKLRKREETTYRPDEDKPVEANPDATGVELHKDSRWHQSWQTFKDNNQVVHKLFDMKTKYDESDHLFFRATRTFTDKFSELFGGMFAKTEMSEVLTEIVKLDPSFDKERFIKECQLEIIPNILEAMTRGDLEILKDWCHEAAFNMLAHPIKQAQEAGYKIKSKVLDVSHVDIAAGKMMEQGPVLVISFTAQQIIVVRDTTGKVTEGDPDKIMKVFHVWAFCRDQTIMDPKAAWRLIDLSSSPSEQWL